MREWNYGIKLQNGNVIANIFVAEVRMNMYPIGSHS